MSELTPEDEAYFASPQFLEDFRKANGYYPDEFHASAAFAEMVAESRYAADYGYDDYDDYDDLG